MIIEHKYYVIHMQFNGLTCLIHICNSWFLVPYKDRKLVWCATNYQNSEENTNHVLIDILKYFSKPCIELLEKSGLDTLICNECKKIVSFKSNLDFFHPKKHIPPWKYGNDNISPCETKIFTACRSMQISNV